jgi:transcription elongation GreA/GreB family factor
MRPEKRALLDELTRLVRADLDAAERAQRETVAGATHEEARPENDKDTRALEQSYLARGQAQRVEQLGAELAELAALRPRAFSEGDPVALGALVTVEEDERSRLLLIAPARGGTELSGNVQVVTPTSPLGRALLGARAGEFREVRLPQKSRELAIVRVE